MDHSQNLKLPYIMPSQAQKHVTHNEALRRLDGIVQIAVLDRDLATPPVSPADGDRYLVASGGADEWSGHDGDLAIRADGAWIFARPLPGWVVWIADESCLTVFDGTDWNVSLLRDSLAMLGINTTADSTNRLAVSSDASLFDHAGAGHQHKINKAAAADTASLLFQSGYSGRAEIGLAGDDDLHVKVSGDGTVWKESMLLSRTSGMASFPAGIAHPATALPVAQLLPCVPVPEIWRSDAARPSTPRSYTVASVTGNKVTLTASSVPQIFYTSMRNVAMVRIWNTTKIPAQPAWVTWNDSTTQFSVRDAGEIATWTNGDTLRLGDPNPTGTNVLSMVAIDISPYLQNNFGTVFRQKGVLISSYAAGTGGDASLDSSGSGAVGAALDTPSMPDGKKNTGSVTLITPELSPVSDSNLIFIRESVGTGTGLAVCFFRLLGLYV